MPPALATTGTTDMALSPSPDNTQGEVALWIAEPQAEEAARLLGKLEPGWRVELR